MMSKSDKEPILKTSLTKFSTLSLADFFFLCLVCISLLIARCIFHFKEANILIAELRQSDEGHNPQSQKERDYVSRLSVIMTMAVAKLPWRTDCLIQCLAAKWLLRRKNIASQFFLGINKVTKCEIAEHAWLKIGNISIPADRYAHMNVLAETLPKGRIK